MKGFSQVKGLDFDQVFSPVVRIETVHLMLVLAALENWYITGLDIRSTYLYGKLDKEIYMEQPEGFTVPGQECKVLCLWCALYGLKQAGLAWWHTLNESLKELRFECLKSEAVKSESSPGQSLDKFQIKGTRMEEQRLAYAENNSGSTGD